MNNLETIKAKIAKLLKLQESSNTNEAANAAAFVERLCREHGVSPIDCQGYDPAEDETIDFYLGDARKRWDPAHKQLINAVAYYYNGRTVMKWTERGRRFHIFASRAAQIQIELYAEYLIETLTKETKRRGGDARYRNSFRKGWSLAISARLAEMKRQQETDGIPETGTPALVALSRNESQQKAALTLRDSIYPRLRTGGGMGRMGHGSQDGRDAAQSVGLSRQVSTASGPRMLAGR
mgnify:FL=1|jgi:hypothetical protein